MSDEELREEFIRAVRQGYPRLPYTGEIKNKTIIQEAVERGTAFDLCEAAVDYTRDLMMDVLDETHSRSGGAGDAQTRILDLALRGLLSERGLI